MRQPMAPQASSPLQAPMGPESIADDPMAQAIELMRQREKVKKFVPDFANR
jgi:hypothetical protein